MKKFLSLLLLAFIAAIGFQARANVTVKVTNPDGVFGLRLGNAYGTSVELTNGTFSWDNTENLVVILSEGAALESISCDGSFYSEGSQYDLGTFYSYADGYQELPQITLNWGYASDGQTVVINNGEDPNGGGDSFSGVKVSVTNPEGVFGLRLGNAYGTAVELTDGYYLWDNTENLVVILSEGAALESISCDGSFYSEGSQYDLGTFYSYADGYQELPQITLNWGYASDGQTVVINNGEGSGSGGGTDTPQNVVYTIYSDQPLFSPSGDFAWSDFFEAGGYYKLTLGKDASGDIVLQADSDWALMGGSAGDGSQLQAVQYPNGNSDCIIPISQFPESETFTLDWGARMTFTSPFDVLQFYGEGVSATGYDNGAYTVSVSYPNTIFGAVKPEFADKYSVSQLKNNTSNVTMTNFQVSVNPSWKSGANIGVTLKFTLTGTGPEGLTVKFGSSAFGYNNGVYTYDRATTATTKAAISAVSGSDAMKVTKISYNGNDYAATDGTATIPASDVDFSVLDFTIDVETVEVDQPSSVWTFNCAEQVLSFSQAGNDALSASYAGGAYSVSGILFENAADLKITADGYNFTNITVAEGSAVKPTPSFEGNQASVATAGFDGNATFTVTLEEIATGGDDSFTWTFKGPEGLSVTYNKVEAAYADGAYTFTMATATFENYYMVEISSALETLQVVSVTFGDQTFERIGNQTVLNVPTTVLKAEDLTFVINTKEVIPGASGYTFEVDDQNHIGSITNPWRSKTYEFTNNVLKYNDTDDLMFFPATGSTIVKVTAGSFDGNAISTEEQQGGTLVHLSSLTEGETYYITTTGPAATDDPTAYVFECPEGDVLDFALNTTLYSVTATYSDGRYVVKPIPAGDRYTYLDVSVKSQYAGQYALDNVSAGSAKVDAVNGKVSIPIAYYPAPAAFTVNFVDGDASYEGFEFVGDNGFYADYTYVNYDWSDGSVKVPKSALSNYGNVVLKIAGGFDLEFVNVTDESGSVYTPANNEVSIPVGTYAPGFVQKFTVTTQAPIGETISFTAQLMNGNPYEASIYVGNQEYDFYTNPQTLDCRTNQTITISANYEPYQVKIDNQVLEADWNYTGSTSGNYVIEPDSEYYPRDGGLIEIYMVSPDAPKYDVTFDFVNEGTEGFLSKIGVQKAGMGLIYYLPGEEEYEDAIANGLLLDEGTNIALEINTTDFTVVTATCNGVEIDLASTLLTYEDIDTDLAFVFDVNRVDGNNVSFSVTGDYSQIYVIDRNFAGESNMDLWYTLDAAETTIEFAKSVEEIQITAKEGYEIPSSDNGTAGIYVEYPADSGYDSEYLNAGTYFPVVDGMSVSVTVNKIGNPADRVFTFYCEADVIAFTGLDVEYKEVPVNAVWTAPAEEGGMGKYVVTDVPQGSFYVGVAQEYQSEYTIDYVEYVEAGNSRISGPNVSLPLRNITGNATFNIVFVSNVPPRNVTIEVNNPSCVSRIYNQNVTMTSFPGTYNLNEGTSLTVEMRANCTLVDVTIDGTSVLSGNTIDLSSAEEGDVVSVNVMSNEGDYIYTFTGPEGLSVKYNSIQAPFEDGMYVVSNVYASTKNDYPVIIEVTPEYANSLKLVSVSDGKTTWEVTGNTGQINIPGSDLPAKNTTFAIQTSEPAPSETVRTVYLTIDDRNVVQYGVYMGGSNAYWGFDPVEEGSDEGVARLTINPQQYEIQVVTTKQVRSITTDVEGTFVMPSLPATSVTLNLSNAVDGQTINLVTADTGDTPAEETITINEVSTVSVSDDVAVLAIDYTVSEGLVGQLVKVVVNSYENSTFTPDAEDGTVNIDINVAGLAPGDYVQNITLTAGNASDNVSYTLTIGAPEVPEESVSIMSAVVGDITNDYAPVTLTYNVSENLVDTELTVSVDGVDVAWFTPTAAEGNTGVVNIDVEGMEPGSYQFTIALSSENASDNITVSVTVAGEEPAEETIKITSAEVGNISEGLAPVTVTYNVSEGLVGEELTVLVNGTTNTWIIPEATTGNTTVVNIDIEELANGSHEFEITLLNGDVSDSATVKINISAIRQMFGDENGDVIIFNLNGVQIKNVDNLEPGIYIINGKKVNVRL